MHVFFALIVYIFSQKPFLARATSCFKQALLQAKLNCGLWLQWIKREAHKETTPQVKFPRPQNISGAQRSSTHSNDHTGQRTEIRYVCDRTAGYGLDFVMYSTCHVYVDSSKRFTLSHHTYSYMGWSVASMLGVRTPFTHQRHCTRSNLGFSVFPKECWQQGFGVMVL